MKKNFELMMVLIVAVVAFIGIIIMVSNTTSIKKDSLFEDKESISGQAITHTSTSISTTTLKRCTVGWKCYDKETEAYQSNLCNWYNLTVCPNGCVNGGCV